ncbi:hypothetical protein L218DRAFT_1007288 [Marasmius fiardii PR-910]|nr:hypothetical protein L218DRAFT_1007288 [Marasmius fiardii PR-910]
MMLHQTPGSHNSASSAALFGSHASAGPATGRSGALNTPEEAPSMGGYQQANMAPRNVMNSVVHNAFNMVGGASILDNKQVEPLKHVGSSFCGILMLMRNPYFWGLEKPPRQVDRNAELSREDDATKLYEPSLSPPSAWQVPDDGVFTSNSSKTDVAGFQNERATTSTSSYNTTTNHTSAPRIMTNCQNITHNHGPPVLIYIMFFVLSVALFLIPFRTPVIEPLNCS